MNPIVQAVLPLAGALIGAGLTFWATSVVEGRRWKRSREARWDEGRMQAYSEYSQSVKNMAWLADRIAASLGYPHHVEPLTADEGLPMLAEAEGERSARWESVLLLGDSETVAAARSWHQAVTRLAWFARGKLQGEKDWEDAHKEMEKARDIYYDAARRDLDINRGSLSGQHLWPPRWLDQRAVATRPERADQPD